MTVTPSGAFAQDLVNGIHRIGVDLDLNPNTLNAGTLTVDGNSVADLTATDLAAQRAQRLDIGNEIETDGLVTITGAGFDHPRVHFDNDGLDDTATGLIIGNHGGDGRLELTAGGTFEIKDLSTTAVDVAHDYDDQEYVVIGRDFGSRGELSVDASTFHVEGNSIFMEIGRNDGDGGGVGAASFVNSSTFQLKAGGAGPDSEVFMQIGRGVGASGTMSFHTSTGTLDSAPGSYATFLVGADGGSGLLELDSSAQFAVNGGAGGADATVGRGTGAVGKVTLARLSNLTFEGGTGNNGLTIGRDAGTGTIELASRSTLAITSQKEAYLYVGHDDAFGTVNAGPETTIDMAGNDRAFVSVGAYGGIGQMMLDDAAWELSSMGDVVMNIGYDGWADGDDSGAGRLTLRAGSMVTVSAGDHAFASLNVGGAAGSIAQLYVTDGSVIDMDLPNFADARARMEIGYFGASSALVVIDGPGSEISHLDFVGIGFASTDNASLPGGHGALTVTNGAQITVDDVMVVGAGGSVGGWNGTVNGGELVLTSGGRIDLRDDDFGDFDVNSDVFIENAGNGIFLDIGANDSNVNTQDGDLITFNGGFSSNAAGRFVVTVNALDGFKFGIGETRVIAEVSGGGANPPTYAVTGQHADFAFYGGGLPANPGEIVIQALNSGLTGGVGILDFGLAGPAATVAYNATANNGTVLGGRFGPDGGSAYNIDRFALTDLADKVTITGTAARAFSYDGRGGNDTINGGAGVDNVFGGIGADILKGNAGNDILNGGLGIYGDQLFGGLGNDSLIGDAGNDTLDGGLGNDNLNGGIGNDRLFGGAGIDSLTGGANLDIFVFNTALSAATNRDIVTDFNHNDDTFQLENAIFTKLAAVGGLNPAFFKAGAATDANDHILYFKASGGLFYDTNGNGAGGAVQFAALLNKPTLSASDFQVI